MALSRARIVWMLSVGLSLSMLAGPVHAARALVLNGSVTNGASGLEVQHLLSMGFTVDLLPSANDPWPTTTAEFSNYDLIVIGDNDLTNPVDLSAAEATALTWGPLIDGNAIIVGGRATYSESMEPSLFASGIAFATAQIGKRGFYCALSRPIPTGYSAGSVVSVLAGLASTDFLASGCAAFELHKSMDHPAFANLSDYYLSFATTPYGFSRAGAFTVFESWPGDFEVVGICLDLVGHNFTGTDGVSGRPFILARGSGLSPVPTTRSAEIDWLHDAFPFNESPILPGTAEFDSTTALVKTGRNIARLNEGPNFHVSSLRATIPGDSLVACSCGSGIRLDLVFRILPGPGNFKPTPRPHMTPGEEPSGLLLRLPTDTLNLVLPGDPSFWGQYMANNGAFGTPGGHHGGTRWDPNTWNSARMDSAELNIFPIQARGNLTGLDSCSWAATYHESDPKYLTLGILKPQCFMIDPLARLQDPNITCNFAPAWLTAGPTGFNGQTATREFTKIIPDGLLTPGSHVEYFIRRSSISDVENFTMVPDTSVVVPQSNAFASASGFCGTGSVSEDLDAHRWQEFSVLPDRWKSPSFGGLGMACMLHVDIASGSGDEADWVVCSDHIGATHHAKWGAHNGWHAATLNSDPNNSAHFVRKHIGQAGTSWDLYSVQKAHFDRPREWNDFQGVNLSSPFHSGFAGSIGSRYNELSMVPGFAHRVSRIGPTKQMLRAYYRTLYATSGDGSAQVFGPMWLRGQEDLEVLSDFVTTDGGTARPRGLLVQGDAMATSLTSAASLVPEHLVFLRSILRAELRNTSYENLSGSSAQCLTSSMDFGSNIQGQYGIENILRPHHDVLQPTPFPGWGARAAAHYPDVGVNGPYVGSIYGELAPPAHEWISWLDGFRLRSLGNSDCSGIEPRRNYMYQLLTQVFGTLCSVAGASTDPLVVDDRLSSQTFALDVIGNPCRVGRVEFEFSLPRSDTPEVAVFDLAGRRVWQLPEKSFSAGTHRLRWDGERSDGGACGPGIYFARLRAPSCRGNETRTIVLLK